MSRDLSVAGLMEEARREQERQRAMMPRRFKKHQVKLPDGRVFTDPYVPTFKQWLFHQAKEPLVLFGGARGGAKTRAIVEDAKALALAWPGIPIVIGRKDLSDMKKTTMREFFLHTNPIYYAPEFGGQYHKGENWVRLFNGSQIWFTELKDVESWRSATVGAWYIDEAKEAVTEDDTRDLRGGLRWVSGKGTCERVECYEAAVEIGEPYREHSQHPIRQIRMATNPGPGWLRDKFYVPYKAGHPIPGKRFIPATVFDNPHLDPQYIKDLLDNPPQWVANFVYGDWASFEGMVLRQFSRATHTWHGPLPQFKVIIGSIDYGSTGEEAHATAAYLTGVTRTGQQITFAEYFRRGAPGKELFEWVSQQSAIWKPRHWMADASQFIANEMLSSNTLRIHNAQRQRDAVEDGINHWDRMMTPNASGKPQWFLTEDCPHLAAGIESYMRDDLGKIVKSNDDAVDACRYGLMELATMTERRPIELQTNIRHSGATTTRVNSILAARRAQKHERMASVLRKFDEEEARQAWQRKSG